jgi:predicted dithiol-disulfide oxidoreductase (DUF899 family)
MEAKRDGHSKANLHSRRFPSESREYRAARDRGQDERTGDIVFPLWNLLDMTPAGRGEDWYPSLRNDLPK